jgi:hypothetical protein
MAQLCDFTNDVGFVPTQDDVTAALTEADRGNLPQSDADRIVDAFENNEPIPECIEKDSLCDFTGPDGIPPDIGEVQKAFDLNDAGYLDGDITTVNKLSQSYENNEPIPECVSDSGIPDESEISVSLDNLQSPSPGEIEATFTVTNTVTSGNGVSDSNDVTITLNGAVAGSEPYSVAPGESQTFTRSFDGLSEGDQYEVCVEI